MKTIHTPGPWQIFWHNYTHFATINKDTKKRICAINRTEYSGTIEEQTANAKLIAAAPELLEALITIRDILETWNTNGNYKNLICHADTFIKKATE